MILFFTKFVQCRFVTPALNQIRIYPSLLFEVDKEKLKFNIVLTKSFLSNTFFNGVFKVIFSKVNQYGPIFRNIEVEGS